MSTADVIVGVSGGVDSSVAALLLQQQGLQVAGLFMQNWADDGSGFCRAEDDRKDAVAVCGKLGIPIHFRDFSNEYMEGVFKHFLDAAMALGATRIATGHYARVLHENGHARLARAVDMSKDQSYFLHQLSEAQLAVTLFPLGEIEKTEVRELARNAGLPTAAKKDSTGICFIGERDFREFLSNYLPMRDGEIQDASGTVLGTHHGVYFHTLGQRGGLQLGGVRGRDQAPWYVVAKDVARNVLVVDQGHDSPWMMSRVVNTEAMHWISGTAPAETFTCLAQTRYRQAPQTCTVKVNSDGTVTATFADPQRAVTPGQSLVLYDGDICLGGAVIAQIDAPVTPALSR